MVPMVMGRTDVKVSASKYRGTEKKTETRIRAITSRTRSAGDPKGTLCVRILFAKLQKSGEMRR